MSRRHYHPSCNGLEPAVDDVWPPLSPPPPAISATQNLKLGHELLAMKFAVFRIFHPSDSLC